MEKINDTDSEQKLNEYAIKMKLDFTKPQDYALGWRHCFEWIKENYQSVESNVPVEEKILSEEFIKKEAKHFAEGWGDNDDEKSFIAGAKWMQEKLNKNHK